QDDIVSDLAARLTQQGVPLKSMRVTSRAPFRLEAIIQSESAGREVAPSDPLFTHAVEREVALARRRYSVGIDWVKVVIVNAQGEAIYWSDVPAKALPDDVALPGRLADAQVAELVRSQLPPSELQLQELSVSLDSNGARVLTIRLSARGIEAANRAIPEFSPRGRLFVLVDKINAEQGARIEICRLDVVDAEGRPLLKYVRDVALAQENWWQAPGVTQDWFPHPLPEPTSQQVQ
ncbi:MAG: hypothetical protein Q8P50_16990, partial [Bacillota bacterium]|nr:hypothetical protein [Bacillota bacterium]